MTKRFLDVWEAAGVGPGATYPSREPDRRIDYIFMRPDPWLQPTEIRVLRTEASDHAPVVATFEFQ